MLFVKLLVQLVDLLCRASQRLLPSARNRVHAPFAPHNGLHGRPQHPAPLQAMEQRIQRPRPNPIPVMRQLLHHRQPKNRLMRRVHQHVDPYQSEIEFPLLLQHSMNITPPA